MSIGNWLQSAHRALVELAGVAARLGAQKDF